MYCLVHACSCKDAHNNLISHTTQVINSQKMAQNSIRIYTVNGKKRIKNDISVCKEDGNRYILSWDHSGERFAV